ncbi:MAG TPA: polyphenol oxidase, partial [Thermopetrobacter sp.]|nr:polyphenol oxidase [Thermopetrobacter sp.]
MAEFLKAENLGALRGVRHGFFTRRGGVSRGIHASLNTGLGSRDARDNALANRARAAAALGAAPEMLCTPRQVHSAICVAVDEPWPTEAPPTADAVATRRPGVLLGVNTADCTPVLFADAEAGVVAAAHAGWKGAIGGVLEATLACMEELGARR